MLLAHTKALQGQFYRNWTRERGRGEHIHTYILLKTLQFNGKTGIFTQSLNVKRKLWLENQQKRKRNESNSIQKVNIY